MFSIKKLLSNIKKWAWTDDLKITKKAQELDEDRGYTPNFSEIDDAIDRGESAVSTIYNGKKQQTQEENIQREETPQQQMMQFIAEVRQYFDRTLNLDSPENSRFKPIPDEWKEHPKFQLIARSILEQQYNFKENVIDQIVYSMLSAQLEQISVEDNGMGEVVYDLDKLRAKMPKSLLRHPSMNTAQISQLAEQLSSHNDYIIDDRSGVHDTYPIRWISDESRMFSDKFNSDMNFRSKIMDIAEKGGMFRGTASIQATLARYNKSADYKTAKEAFMNVLSNPPLGRLDKYNPKTGRVMKSNDYPVSFFSSRGGSKTEPGNYLFTNYLPDGVSLEDVQELRRNSPEPLTKDEREQQERKRNQLMSVVKSLIDTENDDLIKYVVMKSKWVAINQLRDELSDNHSLDATSPDGEGRYGDLVSEQAAKSRVTQRSDDLEFERWESTLKRYAPYEDGSGGIINRISDSFGNQLMEEMDQEMVEVANNGNAETTATKGRNVDMIQLLLEISKRQAEDLFTMESRTRDSGKFWSKINEKGDVRVNGKTNEVASWGNIVSRDHLFEQFQKMGKLKQLILLKQDKHTPAAQFSSSLVQELSAKGEKDPIILALAGNENFVQRARMDSTDGVDFAYFGKRGAKSAKSLKEKYNVMWQSMFHLIIPTLVKKQQQIDEVYADDPKQHEIETAKFINERRVFSNILGVHSEISVVDNDKYEALIQKNIALGEEYKKELEAWNANGKQGKPPRKKRPALAINIAKRLSNLIGKQVSNREAYLMMVGHRPLPMYMFNQKEAMASVVWKHANQFLSKLSQFSKRLVAFQVNEDFSDMYSKTERMYNEKIRKLRE